jgi:alpha-glucosidase
MEEIVQVPNSGELKPEFNFSIDKTDVSFSIKDLDLKIKFLNSRAFRARYKNLKNWERDFSYALDPNMELLHAANAFEIIDDADTHIRLVSEVIQLHVNKKTLMISVFNQDGLLISEDKSIQHFPHYENGSNIVHYKRKIEHGEHFYGLGDKPTSADLLGKKLTIWGSDQYGFYDYTDPLYKNIPFFIGLHHHEAYGIFIDNTYKSTYDFGNDERTEMNVYLDGGELNYYFFYGPHMVDVTKQYTLITGVPELPPLWALGYQQCKWSYYPEAEVYDVTNKLREHKIPCDVIYLDIDYMDGFRCFTWDKEKFPEPKNMIANLKAKGFKTVVIIDPGIKVDEDYKIFQEAIANDYFCKAGEGGYIEGKVWPGDCYFPDFTNPKVRKWWSGLFKDLIQDKGVAGVWNDMNEPALFDVPNKSFPSTVRHNYEGEESSHKRVHNVYGMQMTRATYEGVKHYSAPNRPLIITRSTYAGGQRFSAGWTGDNIASWEHISIANIQTQRLSISGFSFVGADIGGFIDQPSGELFSRWIASAVLHPFFRNHSSGDHGNQEPWSFDNETLNNVRTMIEVRYKFLPYIYSTFFKYVQYADPMLIPGYMYDQDDMHTHYRGDEVILGESVLFCPVYTQGAKHKSVYLPKGNWYYYFNDHFYEGNDEYSIEVPMHEALIFIKAGSLIPHHPVMNYVGEKSIDQLYIHLYFSEEDNDGLLIYEDQGDGYDYQLGKYNEVTYQYQFSNNTITIIQKRKGTFIPQYTSYLFEVHGLKKAIKNISVDGQKTANDLRAFTTHYDFEKLIIELV